MRNLWIALVLAAVGAIVFSLPLGDKGDRPKPVVMEEVFEQSPAKPAAQVVADPVKSPAIVTSPVNGKEEGFTIQVYSFQDRARAEKALGGLAQAGYKSFIEDSDLGDFSGVFFIVDTLDSYQSFLP